MCLRFSRQKHIQEKNKADTLGNGGRNTCAGDPHIKLAHQEPVSKNIEDSPCCQSDHGEQGLSLIAQDIVENAACRHDGGGNEDEQAVRARIRKDGFRTA